ncbi:MAG: hypothetical protein RL134_1174, partial [Actinomycetota bacterium]
MLTSRLLAAVVTGAVAAALLTTPALAAEGGGAAPTAPQQSTTPGLDAPAQDTTASTSTGTGSRTPSAAAAAVRKSPKADRVLRGGDPTSTVSEVLRCTTTKRHFVSVPGPAGITIGGWARCSGGVGTFTAVSGTGRIGGRTLPSDGFSGTITGTGNGATTGQISAVVPDSPQILPSSTGRLLLVMVPQGSGWKATVVGTQSSRAGALRMSGPLAADGSFTMSVRGAVRFAGGQVPVRGSFRSAYASRKDWWDVKGTGGNLRTAGATLLKPSLTLSSTRKGISGTTQARITQLGVTAPARLDVVGADTWRATVTGSATETVNDPRLKGLVLSTGELAGHFGMRAGSAAWAVTVPMALSSGRVKVRGGATLGAPDAITLKPAIAFGDVFSQGRTVVFTRSLGSLTLAGSKAFGQLVVGASGEELVDMPSGWLSSTVLSLSPRKVGKSWTLSQAVRYGMREGTTEFTLVGDLPVAGPFSLKAEGHLQIGQTAIPITGSYTSPGYAGSPAPRMNITAKTDDAPGGFAVVSPGAHATDRIFTYSTDEPASSALATRSSSMPTVKVTTTSSTSSSGGSITLQVNDVSTSTGGDTIELTGGWTYSNNTYTITVQGEGDGFWEPYDGMDIPIDSIEGVIKLDQQKNVTSWSVTTGSVSWDVGDGITIEDTLSLSSTCPSDQVSCPTTTDDTTWDASDAFFISGTSSIMNIPVMSGVTIPSLSGSGAFLSNATWVRWDAAVDGDEPITVEGPADSTISMDQATVTIFSGTRDDSIPNLQMPDLSALSKNKVNVQACGTFQVVILDINTGKSKGCVGLTSKGKAMGQTGTGGTAPGGGVVSPTDDDSGLTLSSTNPPAVNGYGYSDIPTSATPTKTSPTMKLYNQIVTLVPGQNNFSANITIPGELIESFGTGITTDTTLVGTGWFAPKTNSFYVDVDVPVNLEVSGAKLEDINVSLTRVNKSSTDHYYDFELDASGEVHIQSHHFPFDASFGLKEGTQDYADISLTVIGEASTQPIGTFDDTSLLSEGDFEPPNVSLIDGSFDGTAPPSDFADGGFEAGLTPNNLIADPSFEDSASFNLLPADAATLDGDVSGNILPNPSYDDVDVLVNGDFEGLNGFNPASVNAWPGWTSYGSTSLYTYTTAGPDSNNPGDQSLCVNNTSSSSTAIGGAQQILGALVAGATYQLSGYVTSGSSSSASAKAYVVDSSYNSLASTSVTAPAQGTWQYFSVNYTPTSTGSPIIVLNAGSKAKACFDNVSLTVVSGSPSGSQITGVLQPDIIEDFDGASSTWDITAGSSVSRVDLGNGNGALKTDGSPNGYWAFKPNGRGDIASGAFDMSVNIYMPGSSGREVADVGFWMSGSGSNATGYIFRLETAHGDGGFYRLTGSGLSAFGGTAPNLDFQTWYNLRIVGYNNQHVVAQLTNLATGDVVYTDSEDLPSSGLRINGVFGQYPDNSTSGGSYWDDFSLSTPSKGGAYVVYGPNARSAPGYLNLTGTVPGWDFLTSAGTSPNAGDTYTYSAYVRSASSTPVTANLRIASVGGSTPESRTQSFTVGSTWTQVRVSIPLQYAHTDMRIGITDASAAGTILVDDQVLQRVPYSVSPTDSTAPTLDVVSMNDQKVNLDTNPSFESNANGWVGTNGGGITRSTAQAYTGTASGQLTRASGSTSDDYVEYQVNGVAPSTTYTVSGYVWLPTGADPSQVYDSRDLLWAVNYTGGTIVTSTQADFTKTGQWQRLSTTITTSATANTLNVRFYTPTGGGWFVDGILVEAGPSLDDYFEGSVDLPNAGNVLLVSLYDSNSKISYTVGTPNAGSTYSFTAQVKSTDGSS